MNVRTVGALFVVAIAMYYGLPLLVSVFAQMLGALEQARRPVPEELYGLRSLQDSLERIYGWVKALVTSPLAAGFLIALGLVLMGLEMSWRRR